MTLPFPDNHWRLTLDIHARSIPKRQPGVPLVATGDIEQDLGVADALSRRELGEVNGSAWAKRSAFDIRRPPGHAIKGIPNPPAPKGMAYYQKLADRTKRGSDRAYEW